MRHGLTLVALLLPLTGCVAPVQPVGYGYYAQQGYPGAYPQPGYPGAYPQSGYPGTYQQSDYAYPGFSYYEGSPTLFVEGATVPLVFFGGGWGYYDSGRHWHRAPAGVEHHLSQRYPGGAGYRPWGGGQGGRPEAYRPAVARPEGYRPERYRPQEVRPEGVRPEGVRSEGFRPQGFRPEGTRPEGVRPEGIRPEGGRPEGHPGGGFRPQVQAPAPASVQRAAAPAAHPEAPPQRRREDEHR